MEKYFGISYEFDRNAILYTISERLAKLGADYICVVDGNVMANVNKSSKYANVVNGSMFSICDGSWTTLLIRWIYGIKYEAYSGSDIFEDLINENRYSMAFLGGTLEAQNGLKHFMENNHPLTKTCFIELPYLMVDEFDYNGIADNLNQGKWDIIWIGLGAPKQECFMNTLKPLLYHGIMLGVGAVFNFYGETRIFRCPKWLRDTHLEFLYRLIKEPKRQYPKLKKYILALPSIIFNELNNKRLCR